MDKNEVNNSFMNAIGNNRVQDARKIKRYCAKQEKCKDCIFFSPKGYLYGSSCLISQLGSPSSWDI